MTEIVNENRRDADRLADTSWPERRGPVRTAWERVQGRVPAVPPVVNRPTIAVNDYGHDRRRSDGGLARFA